MGAVAGYDSWRLKGAQPFSPGLDYNSLSFCEVNDRLPRNSLKSDLTFFLIWCII